MYSLRKKISDVASTLAPASQNDTPKPTLKQDESSLWLRSKADSGQKPMTNFFSMKTVQVRWRALLAFTIVMLIGAIYLFAARKLPSCPPSSPLDPDFSAIWYYCNSPDIGQVLGQEGEVPTDKYNLEMVQLTIRHGDRFTLHTLPDYKNPTMSCDVSDFQELGNHVPKFENFLESMQKNANKVRQSSHFYKYGLYPDAKECQPGHLTPHGAAQHVKNGAFLKKAYLDKWQLLNDDYQGQVRLVSTLRRRTFQSGIALLYGLLAEFDITKIHVTDALDGKMCSRLNPVYPCTCNSVARFLDVIAGTFGQTQPKFMANKELQQAYRQVSQALGCGQKDIPWASHVMDVGIVHMCHRLRLPGTERNCIKPAALRAVVEVINENGRLQQASLTYQRTARLRMVPLLTEQAKNMEERIHNRSPVKFVLYSGHDSTIDPLRTALNISDGIWPMYAARVAVELYSTKEEAVPGPKRYFFRVLYNGFDVTQKVVFCRGRTRPEWSDMCPLSYFQDFIKDENIVKDLKLNNYTDGCRRQFLPAVQQ